MVFQEILKEIVEGVEGGIGGMIIGRDGIALETYLKEGGDGAVDIQAFGVELVTSIGEFHRAARALDADKLEELSLVMPEYVAVLRLLNPEYFLVTVIAREGNFGKARWLMRREMPRLQAEL